MTKAQIMARAWEIFRTLVGDRIAKLSMALRQAWAEAKAPVKKMFTGKINPFRISLLGREHTIDYGFEGYNMLEAIEKIKADIVKPHVLSTGGSHIIHIAGIDYDPFYEMMEACKLAGAPEGFKFVEFLLSVSDEDTERTAFMNRGLRGTYYRAITFHDDFAQVVINECNKTAAEINQKLEQAIAEEESKVAAAEAEKQRILSGIEWTTAEKKITDEGGRTTEYVYTITYNGKKYTMIDRNLFDVGRVVNYAGGHITKRSGAYCVERLTNCKCNQSMLTADEQRVAEAVIKYGRYAKCDIRM